MLKQESCFSRHPDQGTRGSGPVSSLLSSVCLYLCGWQKGPVTVARGFAAELSTALLRGAGSASAAALVGATGSPRRREGSVNSLFIRSSRSRESRIYTF